MVTTLTILIVEDNADEAFLLNRAVCAGGLTNSVRIVADGEEALRYLQGLGEYANRVLYPLPNIIFADLKMPGMGGMAVLKWIKSHPQFFVIPIIVLTSSDLDSDIQGAYALGANAYMVKPVKFEALQAMVNGALEFWGSCRTPHPMPNG